MRFVSVNGFKINFVGNPITGSACYFDVIIPKFIFKPIYEINISEKNFWHQNIFL